MERRREKINQMMEAMENIRVVFRKTYFSTSTNPSYDDSCGASKNLENACSENYKLREQRAKANERLGRRTHVCHKQRTMIRPAKWKECRGPVSSVRLQLDDSGMKWPRSDTVVSPDDA